MKVLLTRPLAQVKALESLVSSGGHQPLLFPTLEINPIKATTQSCQYDVVIFISVNAVEHGLALLKTIQYNKIFSVGAATAQKLNDYNILVDDFPIKNPSSETLLALECVSQLQHKKILIFRGKGGRETLKIGLEKKLNSVEYVEVYQRVICTLTNNHKNILNTFFKNNLGVINVTSNENLDALMQLSNQFKQTDKLKQYSLIVLSERTKNYAHSLGFLKVLVTRDISNQAILSTLVNINTLDN